MDLLQTLCFVLVGFSCLLKKSVHAAQSSPLCTFPKYEKAKQDEMHRRIQPLLGRTYKFVDDSGDYNYDFSICTNVDPKGVLGPYAAVVQHETTGTTHVIGRYNNTQLINGSDWLILEYLDGDQYHSHCGSEKRKSRLMITCDRTVEDGKEQIVVIEEEKEKSTDCYYLFELGTSLICPKEPIITVSLSVGSILVIIFIVVVILYLGLGFLYNRLVLGAKGKEQIPNYSFWQDFGNLQADGCNFICRSGNKPESKQYKGLGDDMLQEESDERDDHLLPM